jgi:hypothetical protein
MKIPDFIIDGNKCVLMASPSEFEAGSTYYSPHQCKTLLNQIELQHGNKAKCSALKYLLDYK